MEDVYIVEAVLIAMCCGGGLGTGTILERV